MSDSSDMDSSNMDSPLAPSISWPSDVQVVPPQQNGASHMLPKPNPPVDPLYLPTGKKSLHAISIRAFCLGVAFGTATVTALQLAFWEYYLWRASFFIATLALFHFLEFSVTARHNPADAKVSSFLLSSNGSAYNVAHTAALIELILRTWLRSSIAPCQSSLLTMFMLPDVFPTIPSMLPVGLGFGLVALGQYVRTLAMVEAGKNFNHIVQVKKKEDHLLVTTGVYSFSRHPSYFGFFWWGLGTQLVLGNHICFPAYAIVLWKFFALRIRQEERFLVQFFGQEYLAYRARTPVLIPFIA